MLHIFINNLIGNLNFINEQLIFWKYFTCVLYKHHAMQFKCSEQNATVTICIYSYYVYMYIHNKENHKGVNEIKNKAPERYSQPSSRGHRE